VILIVASVAFEVCGLGLVAWQLGRVRRREFGTPAWITRLRGRWQRLRGRKSDPQTVSGTGAGEVGTVLGGSVRMHAAPGAPIEQRLGALERNFAALDKDTTERFRQHDERHGQLQQRIDSLDAELRGEQAERERERREQLRESMAFQWWGTGLFFIGAVMAGAANGVC
jgi:hypothetical protein